jgi:hypothetical protein
MLVLINKTRKIREIKKCPRARRRNSRRKRKNNNKHLEPHSPPLNLNNNKKKTP